MPMTKPYDFSIPLATIGFVRERGAALAKGISAAPHSSGNVRGPFKAG